jgi:anti-anti-sigma factor
MSVRLEANGNTLLVRGLRELAAFNADEFKAQVLAALADDLRFIEGDMSGLEFIDSRGLGALISLHRVCRSRNGRLRLVNPSSTGTGHSHRPARTCVRDREPLSSRLDQDRVRLSQAVEGGSRLTKPFCPVVGLRRFRSAGCEDQPCN